jgi:CDP-4-dehydro-6-deoxyglucose reductase, E3
MRDATLIAARMLTPQVRELTVGAGEGFRFLPGQWVSFRLPDDGESRVARAYSIASAPRDDGIFQVAITRVEGGPGSNYLHTVEPPTVLPMTGPEGFFTLHPPDRPILMIATGTGVSPMRSMLLSHERLPRTILLLGSRTHEDLVYREDFEQIATRCSSFAFEPTLSRAHDGWEGRRGYVQTHVKELVAELGGDCDVYVCGLHKMIQEVRAVVRTELGMPRQRIHTERYD